ncbi:MAG: hypothetical protein ACYC9O_12800, partial [Candidatus Latescibacterota bacterium]
MRRILTAFLIFLTIICGGCIFNTGDEKYSVSGTITTKDDGPLNGIYVRLGEMAVRTDSNGFYKFTDIGFNSYFIEADPYDYYSIKYRFE